MALLMSSGLKCVTLLGVLTYLNCELSGWAENDGLNLFLAQHVVLTEVLCYGQTEAQSFPTSSQVASDHILAIVNRIEAMLLDGEQILVVSRDQQLSRSRIDLGEAGKLAVSNYVALEAL